jgi:hypothetical protein
MLRTTIVKNELAWALIIITASCFSIPCFGQEESFQDPASKPQSSVFEKLFGKPNVQPAETKKPKPKVPAMQTAGKPSRSGFLMPLKSFSRSFRGSPESEDFEDSQESAPTTVPQNRIPREPFRNLPRVQERRDRETNDIQVEQMVRDLPPVSSRSAPSKPAPIVTPESLNSPRQTYNGANASNAFLPAAKSGPAKTTSPKPVVAGSSKSNGPEILIESNSTSRRTAMDEVADQRQANRSNESFREIQRNAGPEASKSRTNNKIYAEPKGLIDLGFASEKATGGLVASASRESESKTLVDSTIPSQRKDIQRTAPPTNSARRESKEVAFDSREKIVTAPLTASDLRREMSVPGVRVTVNGPSSILIDDAGKFEVVAKNEGSEPLSGLIVRIAVPAHVAVSDVAVTDGVALPDNSRWKSEDGGRQFKNPKSRTLRPRS